MATSIEMLNQIKEYIGGKCAEAGGIYQPESIDILAGELGLSKDEFMEARASLQVANELFITRGPKTKYSLTPFSTGESKASAKGNDSIDVEALSDLKSLLEKVNIGQLAKEFRRLRSLEDSLGKPSITKSGNTVIKTFTVVEER